MNAIKNEAYYNKLKNRRGEIMRTLEHVQKEQRTVDENKEWIDRAAHEADATCSTVWPTGTSTKPLASTTH